MNKSNFIIELKNITKSFGNKVVLDNVSLNVKKGEFVTILGPSGCGKTTLLRSIAGFVTPDEGQIHLNGELINDVPPYERQLNTVFQRYALFPHLNVYENIAFGLKLQNLPKDEIEKRVRKVLKLVSMSDYEWRDVESLSGGQQQRVAIARAIVNRPQVLLLDEPLAALDLKMRHDMQMELKEMHKNLGITFIYVTHDQEEALTLSDTIVVMNDGVIQQVGTPIDIYNEPVNPFVADFIGESNILNATMIEDRKVEFMNHEFECVDENMGVNAPVDVVVRPEDIYILPDKDNPAAMLTGKVMTSIFKGVHYEMTVVTDDGYELMIQDYNCFPVGSEVGLIIRPNDIHVMKKVRLHNTFSGTMADSTHVKMLGGVFECKEQSWAEGGEEVEVTVAFKAVDMMDDTEDGTVDADVQVILYMGNHYHLRIRTLETREPVFVDTNDIWDEGDIVGIKILPKDIKIKKLENEA
ncbi:MAG: ABC transporter ATP-binding protein [Bacteroidales bacterium]|nr:ABC transporter ATP-binding protein [Bacteroidales bacterium]